MAAIKLKSDDKLQAALRRIRTQAAVNVEDAATAYDIGRATAYGAIKSGEWPSITAGGRIKVPTAWLRSKLMLDEGD